MSEQKTEQNKALIREFLKRLDKGEPDVVQRLSTLDYRANHMPGLPGPLTAKQHDDLALVFLKAFPDLIHVVHDQIAEGDRVVTRGTVKGTHNGDFQGIAPTGNKISIPFVYVARLAGEKIAEDWDYFDVMGFMQQIGAVPAAQASVN